MTTYYTTVKFDAPVDEITITSNGLCITGIYMESHRHGPSTIIVEDWELTPDDKLLSDAAQQLISYMAGDLTIFHLPVELVGTEFQKRVWQQLTQIPYGTTISYGELAKRIGNVNASRAVGLANGKNPVSIVVPCHRVIGANGKLVGYGGGIERKIYFLDLERKGKVLDL